MNEDPAHTQRLIDEEIATLRRSIVSLTTRRNDLSPISRLPVEIISTILCLYQQSALAEDDTSVKWTKITHVCRQWRDISVNLPKLWTHIPFNYPLWAQEMLIRSQNSDLVVRAIPGFGTHPSLDSKLRSIRSCIKQHFTRVQEIDIRGFDKRIPDFLQALLPRARGTYTRYAPQLRILRLSNCFLEKDPMPILDEFFVYANNLEVFEVSCTNRWDSRLFMGLTHLKVENPKRFQRPSPISFYNALKRMPLLQSLELRGDVLPLLPPRDRSTNGSMPVSLLALERLILVDDALALAIFVGHVSFPSASFVSIRCSAPAAEYGRISDTMAALPTIYTPSSHPVRGLRVDITKNYVTARHPDSLQIDFDTWSNVASAETLQTDRFVGPFTGDAFLSLGFTWKTSDVVHSVAEAQECRNVIADFCLAVPCKTLSVLSLTSSEVRKELPMIDDAIFLDILGTQPELHSMFITGRILHLLLKNLLPQATTTQTSTPHLNNSNNLNDSSEPGIQTPATSTPRILFPNMRYLSVSDADCSLDGIRLFDCLFARLQAGYKLETVSLSECCGLNGDLIDLLGEVVSNIIWG